MTEINIKIEYQIGEIVEMVTDYGRNKFLVTAYRVDHVSVMYHIAGYSGNFTVWGYEIRKAKN